MSPMPRGHEVRPFAERFWSKVAIGQPDECWPWLGATNEYGYGSFRGKGRTTKAHRVAWELEHPDAGALSPSEHVCHICDNPPCVNPAHLYVGDYKTNTADKVERRRHLTGAALSAALRPHMPRGDNHWTHRMPERMNLSGLRRG